MGGFVCVLDWSGNITQYPDRVCLQSGCFNIFVILTFCKQVIQTLNIVLSFEYNKCTLMISEPSAYLF